MSAPDLSLSLIGEIIIHWQNWVKAVLVFPGTPISRLAGKPHNKTTDRAPFRRMAFPGSVAAAFRPARFAWKKAHPKRGRAKVRQTGNAIFVAIRKCLLVSCECVAAIFERGVVAISRHGGQGFFFAF